MGAWWSEWKVAKVETWICSGWLWFGCSYHWCELCPLWSFPSNQLFIIQGLCLYVLLAGGYYGSGRHGGKVIALSSLCIIPYSFSCFFDVFYVLAGGSIFGGSFGASISWHISKTVIVFMYLLPLNRVVLCSTLIKLFTVAVTGFRCEGVFNDILSFGIYL